MLQPTKQGASAASCAIILRHPRRPRRARCSFYPPCCWLLETTRPELLLGSTSSSREYDVICSRMDADETGAAGGAMPIFFISSTLLRGRYVHQRLRGNPFAPKCTSSVNRAIRRAASRGMGITSLVVGMPTMISSATPGCPNRGGTSCGNSCTDDNGGESIAR